MGNREEVGGRVSFEGLEDIFTKKKLFLRVTLKNKYESTRQNREAIAQAITET